MIQKNSIVTPKWDSVEWKNCLVMDVYKIDDETYVKIKGPKFVGVILYCNLVEIFPYPIKVICKK